jgi:hypothetical protein
MSDVSDHLPCVFIVIAGFPECWHPRPTNTVLDDPIEFAIGHLLCLLRAQVGGTGIHDAVKLRVAGAVVAMTNRTMLLVMPSGFDQAYAMCRKRILQLSYRSGVELS